MTPDFLRNHLIFEVLCQNPKYTFAVTINLQLIFRHVSSP